MTKEEMKKGDHIYIKTGVQKIPGTKILGITHHGIYCGNGTVIHFDGHAKKICRHSLERFSDPSPVSAILVLQQCPPDSADAVVKRAESFLGKSGYSLVAENCEHFASYCITGKWESKQINDKLENSKRAASREGARPHTIRFASEIAKQVASGQRNPLEAAFVFGVVLFGAVAWSEIKYRVEKASEKYGVEKASEEATESNFIGTSKPSGDGMFEVLASSGDTHLGDNDFDKKIVDFLADEFRKAEGIDLRRDKQALQRLTKAAQKARIELSSVTQTYIYLPFITVTRDGPIHLDITLARAKFEELCSD